MTDATLDSNAPGENAPGQPNVRKELRKIIAQEAGPIRDRISEEPGSAPCDEWAIACVSVGNMRFHPWHSAELGTQVLMGTVLKVLSRQNNWWYVQSPDQYPGWIEHETVVPGNRQFSEEWIRADKLLVTELYERIYEKPDKYSFPVSDATIGVLVKDVGRAEGWARVELPDGRPGFLKQSSCTNYERWKRAVKASPENIERAAKSLLGLPYLWGGTSPKAVDCSGFTKVVYFLNGIQLNRDAVHQSMQGAAVSVGREFENLRKGDLLFFGKAATGKRPEEITHVAIYLEQQTYIHASGMVRINSLDRKSRLFDEKRLKTFLRARRILPLTAEA